MVWLVFQSGAVLFERDDVGFPTDTSGLHRHHSCLLSQPRSRLLARAREVHPRKVYIKSTLIKEVSYCPSSSRTSCTLSLTSPVTTYYAHIRDGKNLKNLKKIGF